MKVLAGVCNLNLSLGVNLQAIAEQQAQADVPSEPKENQPARAAGTYTPPEWSGMPEG